MSRKELVAKLFLQVEALLNDVSKPRIKDNCFGTEEFIYQVAHSILKRIYNESDLKKLDRLCKKVDVQKKLKLFYKQDLSKAVVSENIETSYAKLLCAVFLCTSMHCNDYKLLNTGMKMVDGGLLEPKVKYDNTWEELTSDILSQLKGEA